MKLLLKTVLWIPISFTSHYIPDFTYLDYHVSVPSPPPLPKMLIRLQISLTQGFPIIGSHSHSVIGNNFITRFDMFWKNRPVFSHVNKDWKVYVPQERKKDWKKNVKPTVDTFWFNLCRHFARFLAYARGIAILHECCSEWLC